VRLVTHRGWAVIAGALLFLIGARLFGIPELFATAAAMVALVVGSAVYVNLVRFTLSASRQVRPARVHAGANSRVDLIVHNNGARRSPVLSVRDSFDGGRRWARFSLAPVAPGEAARAAYRLPTDERGVFSLGPLEFVLNDPFGLATKSTVVAGRTTLVVYPRIHDIRSMADTQGPDPAAGTGHPTALSQVGEEFYALREYQTGDDLRRVHWPSTARLDELMIRQDDMPWQGRATVVVDMRRNVHMPESFELALSAAASIADACQRRRSLVRLVLTNGTDTDFGSGPAHIDGILERLAAAHLQAKADLTPALASLRRAGGGGAVSVITTARAASSDLQAIARLRNRYGAVTLVLFERSSTEAVADAAPKPVPRVGTVVRVTADHPFPDAWDRAMATAATTRIRPAFR
jgi:uncharacterized protein (DUF58 family)